VPGVGNGEKGLVGEPVGGTRRMRGMSFASVRAGFEVGVFRRRA
jgi:hypothetical protein